MRGLEAVEYFKYLGSIISNEGSKSEIVLHIAQTTAALSRLKIIWRDKTSHLLLKLSWCGRSSYPPICVHVRAGTRKKDPSHYDEMLSERLLNISYKDHVTNEEVRNRIQDANGEYDDLLTMVKKRKLRWCGGGHSFAGDSKRYKKERKTYEKIGKQHQRMGRNGVWRFPQGNGRQAKVERHVATSLNWVIFCYSATAK